MTWKLTFQPVRQTLDGRAMAVYHNGEWMGDAYRDHDMDEWCAPAELRDATHMDIASGCRTAQQFKAALRREVADFPAPGAESAPNTCWNDRMELEGR